MLILHRTDTKKSSPLSRNEGLKEIKKNAEKFEEKMYTDATSEVCLRTFYII